MSAPLRLPRPQTDALPDELPVPKDGWLRRKAAERDPSTHRVFEARLAGYRVTITEAADGRLSGTVCDHDRLWMLTDESTLQAWLAAMQCIEGRRWR